MNARLQPLPHFFITSHGDYTNSLSETATIHLTLRNVTSAPILVTGALTDFRHAARVRTSAGMTGVSTLAASHAGSALILLKPGEQQEVSLDRAVRLRGLAAVLPEFDWLRTAGVFDTSSDDKPRTPAYLADQSMLPSFNQLLSKLYGRAARIGITIFEGDYAPLAKVEIPVAEGVDQFYRAHSGGLTGHNTPVRFDHSMFLAAVMLDFRRYGSGRGPAPRAPEREAAP